MITASRTQPATVSEPDRAAAPAAEPSRRPVVQVAVVRGIGEVVAGSGALGYRIYDNVVLDPGGQAYDPGQHWHDNPGPLGAASAAFLAADPNSSQPWIFQLAAGYIDLYADATRGVGPVDPFKREQYVGLGGALENLALACQARGLGPATELLPDGAGAARVAHVQFSPSGRYSSPLYDAIGQPQAQLGSFESRPIPAETLTTLVDMRGLGGLSVVWVTEPRQTTALGELLIDAANALTRDAPSDSFAWFRRTYDAVTRRRDGLTRPVQASTATAYGVITAADPYDRATQLVAGRLLQRIHLTATSHGMGLQPMNEITEHIDRERAARAPATAAHRFAKLLPAGAQPLATFRVGYATGETGPGLRRPAAAEPR